MSKKKLWLEKLLDDTGLPKVAEINERMSMRQGEGSSFIRAPREVDELMRRAPEKRLITISEIRSCLAERHGVTIGCPITTGIFAWIAARAADEASAWGGDNAVLAATQDRWSHQREIPGRC